MPSIINSDDGVVSGTSGLKTTGGNDGALNIQTNGSNAISISSGQRSTFPTTIGVGGATPSTSGSGISFPATQSASTDANTLDDYEEGTFTVTISGSSSGSGTVAASAYYIKIGKQVTVWVRIDNKTFPTYSGNLLCSLPFVAANTNNYAQGPLCYYYPLADWDTLANFVGFRPTVLFNTATAQFGYKLVDGDWQNLITSTNTTTSNTSGLYLEFTVSYFTD